MWWFISWQAGLFRIIWCIIGYTFGSVNQFEFLFALPNVTNKVIGFKGNTHKLAEIVNDNIEESIALTINNLPSHSHYIMTDARCESNWG